LFEFYYVFAKNFCVLLYFIKQAIFLNELLFGC
jgi:hypothetical protein